MKLLLLGGPRFLGRAIADAALERGHELTFFNRGTTNPDLYPEVERIVGDRAGDLTALGGRTWDAVIDTSGYLPSDVRASAEALARLRALLLRVEHLRLCGLREAERRGQPGRGARRSARGRGDERELRSAQGALRGSRARRLPRARPGRSSRAHRRTARSDRPVHVLAASRRSGRRGRRTRSSGPPDAGDRRAGSR